MIKHITKEDFDKEVLKGEGYILVDFWAPWCGPCKMLGPVLEELAVEFEDKLTMVKLNVDENQEIAGKFDIMGIPTMKIFNNGTVVETIVGFNGKDNLRNKLLQVL